MFDNQSTCRFTIHFANPLDGYDDIDIANLWCALMSLALGKDVQWTSYFEPHKNAHRLRRMQIWQSKQLEAEPHLLSPIDLSRLIGGNDWENNNIKEFIVQCFRTVLKGNIRVEEARSYTNVLRHYANYRLLPASSEEGHARLISTLTEELLWQWEKHRNLNRQRKIMDRGERNKLVEILVSTMKHKAHSFLNEENAQKLDAVVDSVESLVRSQVRSSKFINRLKNLFITYDIPIDEKLDMRLQAFVETRDSIAHTGLFAHDNPDITNPTQLSDEEKYAISHEIDNNLMMIPLMIFAIFGYKGKYYDFLEHKENVWGGQE